jgi:hypothetical protein
MGIKWLEAEGKTSCFGGVRKLLDSWTKCSEKLVDNTQK